MHLYQGTRSAPFKLDDEQRHADIRQLNEVVDVLLLSETYSFAWPTTTFSKANRVPNTSEPNERPEPIDDVAEVHFSYQ